MPKALTLKEAYAQCQVQGMLLPQKDVDVFRIQAMLRIAEEDLKTIEDLKSKKDRWNTLYKLSYDVIHTLTEALLLFDKVKSANHQCLFSYLCTKHPELDLHWEFFEKFRTKRNGIHYYGESVNQQHWNEVALQATLYTKVLKEKVIQRLKK